MVGWLAKQKQALTKLSPGTETRGSIVLALLIPGSMLERSIPWTFGPSRLPSAAKIVIGILMTKRFDLQALSVLVHPVKEESQWCRFLIDPQ